MGSPLQTFAEYGICHRPAVCRGGQALHDLAYDFKTYPTAHMQLKVDLACFPLCFRIPVRRSAGYFSVHCMTVDLLCDPNMSMT